MVFTWQCLPYRDLYPWSMFSLWESSRRSVTVVRPWKQDVPAPEWAMHVLWNFESFHHLHTVWQGCWWEPLHPHLLHPTGPFADASHPSATSAGIYEKEETTHIQTSNKKNYLTFCAQLSSGYYKRFLPWPEDVDGENQNESGQGGNQALDSGTRTPLIPLAPCCFCNTSSNRLQRGFAENT